MSAHHITSDDFCRACRGACGHYETQPAYAYGKAAHVWQACWLCGGSGKQSVSITPVAAAKFNEDCAKARDGAK